MEDCQIQLYKWWKITGRGTTVKEFQTTMGAGNNDWADRQLTSMCKHGIACMKWEPRDNRYIKVYYPSGWLKDKCATIK